MTVAAMVSTLDKRYPFRRMDPPKFRAGQRVYTYFREPPANQVPGHRVMVWHDEKLPGRVCGRYSGLMDYERSKDGAPAFEKGTHKRLPDDRDRSGHYMIECECDGRVIFAAEEAMELAE